MKEPLVPLSKILEFLGAEVVHRMILQEQAESLQAQIESLQAATSDPEPDKEWPREIT